MRLHDRVSTRAADERMASNGLASACVAVRALGAALRRLHGGTLRRLHWQDVHGGHVVRSELRNVGISVASSPSRPSREAPADELSAPRPGGGWNGLAGRGGLREPRRNMAGYSSILVEHRGAIARITLNRPEKRNPIGPATCGELVRALAELKGAAETRVIVLTGAGVAFSAGGDLSAMSGAPDAQAASLVELLLAMHDVGKPLIAMVNGPAFAGGLGIMVACDVAIAADTATFSLPEIAVGLWPMMITAEITRNVGRKKTLELMLTGRRIDAAEALSCGLVTRVVPAAELEAATDQLAGELAERSPAAVALGLRAFYASQDLALEPQLRYLEAEFVKVLALDDAREGITAFLTKRKPVWTGK